MAKPRRTTRRDVQRKKKLARRRRVAAFMIKRGLGTWKMMKRVGDYDDELI